MAETGESEFEVLDESVTLEEELVRGYKAEHYYPVYIGEFFQDRYKVTGKLGPGSASNVWLCHDLLEDQQFVALKVHINSSKVHREPPVYRHIDGLHSKHKGSDYIRGLLDSFELDGSAGKHICLVHEALGMNIEELKDLIPDGAFEPDLIRQTLREILRGMHFLRHDAHFIHTGGLRKTFSSRRVC